MQRALLKRQSKALVNIETSNLQIFLVEETFKKRLSFSKAL